MSDSDQVPRIKGGQGRDDEEVEAGAEVAIIALGLVCLFLLSFLIYSFCRGSHQ